MRSFRYVLLCITMLHRVTKNGADKPFLGLLRITGYYLIVWCPNEIGVKIGVNHTTEKLDTNNPSSWECPSVFDFEKIENHAESV